MTPLPCPCGRGMRAVLRDHAGNPVRLADRCKTCSAEAFGPRVCPFFNYFQPDDAVFGKKGPVVSAKDEELFDDDFQRKLDYLALVSKRVFAGRAGDTYIVIADWAPDGSYTLDTIHQYGSATNDAFSPHYADQAPLFAAEQFKRPPMKLDALLKEAERDYRPGKEAAK